MKKLIFTAVFFCLAVIGFSQSDTLFTNKNQKIPCKIFEINEFEIKYRMANMTDGPIYVIDKSTVRKYTLSNGFTEFLKHDEMSLEHEHKEILGNRQVIKIHPFSFATNHLSFAYEKVIKVGMNLDCEVGYLNSELTGSSSNGNVFGAAYYYNNPFFTGAYIKPGMKFFLGQDFSVKGLKYAHPLKGRYFKFDIAVSYVTVRDIQAQIYNNYPTPPTTINTDLNTVAYGAFINYGRQFILGNLFTLDYYVGAGFTGQSYSYSNPSFLATSRYYGDYGRYTYNYGGFIRTPGVGFSVTAGLRLGYIIPDKSTKAKKVDTGKTL